MQNSFHIEQPSSNLDLPVIQKQIKVYKYWQDILSNFPKTSKYSLGTKIDNTLIETINLTFSALYSKSEQKLNMVSKAGIKLDLVKFLLRIAWEIKALDNKRYAAISEQLDEIGRMVGGWAKQLKRKSLPNMVSR
jgi:hypothetical protein